MYSKTRAARFGAVLIGALLLGFSSGAKALPMTELALVLDASGSIGAFDWNTQITGYSNALNTLLPIDGSVAVSVIRFSTTATVVLPMMTIDSVGDRTTLSNFFLSLPQIGDGELT